MAERPARASADVAIVGLACRFPGAADQAAFWELIAAGGSAISEIPADRWDAAAWHARDPAEAGKSVSKWGGFLDDIFAFDHRFFDISAREARAMDPQQRLLLEETWRAIEDAGLRPSALRGRRVAVHVGVMAIDHHQDAVAPELTDSYSCLGTYQCILANRISHLLGLRGPSLAIDAACASSLVALHQARLALLQGEADLAIVGGVSAILRPWKYVSFSKARMLSPDGQCRTFDAAANGYVPGEGVGVVILQRTAEAIADGMRIRGLVKGSAVNHCGGARSITAPSVAAQEEVLLDAYWSAGLSPATLGYVEAHGTGTPLGDPMEVEALTRAFRRHTPARQFCRLGAVKTNIGHLEAAAGIAGVIKLLLMLEHRRIPPLAQLRDPNPVIAFETSPFRLPLAAEPWLPAAGCDVLRAGVSSFGFGGVNSHAVIEQAPPAPAAGPPPPTPACFVLSAKSAASLARQIAAWRDLAARDRLADLPLGEVCRTLTLGRDAFPHRFGGLVRTAEDVRRLLAEAPREIPASGAFRPVLHLLPGAARDGDAVLPAGDPLLAPHLAACREALGRVTATPEALLAAPGPVRDLARSYALGAGLIEAGIVPAHLQGQGSGALAAAALAGVARLEQVFAVLRPVEAGAAPDGPKLSRPRIAFLDHAAGRLLAPIAVDAGYPARLRQQASAAAASLPRIEARAGQLAGQRAFRRLLDEWAADLAACGIDADPSRAADPDQPLAQRTARALAFLASLRQLEQIWDLGDPEAAAGDALRELGDLTRDEACTRAEALQILLGEAGDAAFAASINRNQARLRNTAACPHLQPCLLPVAPGAVPGNWLRGLAAAPAPPPVSGPWIALTPEDCRLWPGGEAAAGFEATLLACWRAGAELDWDRLQAAAPPRRLSLPGYCFDRRNLALVPRGPAAAAPEPPPPPPPARLSAEACERITADHLIDGAPIAPAALQIQLAVDSAEARGAGRPTELSRLGFLAPLRLAPGEQPDILWSAAAFRIEQAGLLLAKGRATAAPDAASPAAGAPVPALPPLPPAGEALDAATVYAALAARGYRYGPSLRGVTRIWLDPGHIVIELAPPDAETALTCLIDGVFQGLLYAASRLHPAALGTALLVPFWMQRLALPTGGEGRVYAVAATQELVPDAQGLRVRSCRLVAADGRAVGEMAGMQMKAYRGTLGPAAPDAAAEAALLGQVEAALIGMLSTILDISASELDASTNFRELGLESLSLTELSEGIADRWAIEMDPAQLLSFSGVAMLAARLVRDHRERLAAAFAPASQAVPPPAEETLTAPSVPAPAAAAAASTTSPDDIAIIGIAGRFPGARNVQALWEHLLAGRDLVGPPPAGRVDAEARRHGALQAWPVGGLLDDIDAFDATSFRISAREAELMDPQQRLMIETCWEAIQDAGYRPGSLSGSATGVFVGISSSDYRQWLGAQSRQAHASTGTYLSIAANRISYLLDLRGPSVVVDTACSSSLVGLHQAVQALRAGDCTAALVGGVNLCFWPDTYVWFQDAHMLSPTHRCKPFSARADGYVRSESVAAILLKPLARALADGDHVHGLVRASAVAHGGTATSLTAPSPEGERDLFLRAWEQAGIDPDSITYIEAHGTGTRLGDPAETIALRDAFALARARRGASGIVAPGCGIGSIKSNIGHTEPASGLVGLIKVLLALRHRTLPASLHCEELNPQLRLEGSPFHIVRQAEPWLAAHDAAGRTLPRRAGVSSFGFGGALAHVVVEEHVAPADAAPAAVGAEDGDAAEAIVPLSARSEALLRQAAAALAAHAASQPGLTLADLAYTLQVGREAQGCRLAVLCRSVAELVELLHAHLAGEQRGGRLFLGQAKAAPEMARPARDHRPAELAALWVGGAPIDWAALQAGRARRRLPLPPTPFEPQRHWFRRQQPASPASPPAASAAEAAGDARSDGLVSAAEASGDARSDGLVPAAAALAGAVSTAPAGAAVAAPAPAASLADLTDEVRGLVAEVLRVAPETLDPHTAFGDVGVDSMLTMEILDALEKRFEMSFEPDLLFEHQTIDALQRHLAQRGVAASAAETTSTDMNLTGVPPHPATPAAPPPDLPPAVAGVAAAAPLPAAAPPPAAPPAPAPATILARPAIGAPPRPSAGVAPIAVIGVACRLPGADGPDAFWRRLEAGARLFGPPPPDRWDPELFLPGSPLAVHARHLRFGAFLDEVGAFDPDHFRMSVEQAAAIDPQHRILLELAQHLFDDAGYLPQEVAGTRCGILLGAAEGGYYRTRMARLSEAQLRQHITDRSANMMAGRIADTYDLRGPALTLDTACSSSLLAVHDACERIRSGACSMAIAGGIELLFDPYVFVSFGLGGVLADEPHCRVFDERARGFVLGEGAGLVLLKDLDAARRDGDRIRAVILGSAANNDGHTMGLTTPDVAGQQTVIERALQLAGVAPREVSYVEAFGAGTLLGDPIEVKAMTRAFGDGGGPWCGVGSVKSNIGHLLHAAGIASLIKVVLSLEAGILPASIDCERPHPRFGFAHSPFHPVQATRRWEAAAGPRRAGVSAFGFGGTNCHAVLEQAPPPIAAVRPRAALPRTAFARQTCWIDDRAVPAADRQVLDALARLAAGAIGMDEAFACVEAGFPSR